MSFSSGNTTEDDQFTDDSIFLVMMSCAALLEVYHDMADEEKHKKCFVRRKRRCVSDIFRELGPYWVKPPSTIPSRDTLYSLVAQSSNWSVVVVLIVSVSVGIRMLCDGILLYNESVSSEDAIVKRSLSVKSEYFYRNLQKIM